MAVKVKLLQKKISGGRKTLYLDFYPAIISLKTGKETRREFLGLYIHEKPKNAIEKQYNAEQLKLAEAIRQQKENTHNKPEIYNEYEKERLRKKELGDRDFVEYFRRTAGKRSGSNHNNWMSALTYLEQFTGGRVKFADLSEQYLEEFKELSADHPERQEQTEKGAAVAKLRPLLFQQGQGHFEAGIQGGNFTNRSECACGFHKSGRNAQGIPHLGRIE